MVAMKYLESKSVLSKRLLDTTTRYWVKDMFYDMTSPLSITLTPYANRKRELISNYIKLLDRINDRVLNSKHKKFGYDVLQIAFPEKGSIREKWHIHATVDTGSKSHADMKEYIQRQWKHLNHNEGNFRGEIYFSENDGSHDVDRFIEYSMKNQTKEKNTVIGNMILY